MSATCPDTSGRSAKIERSGFLLRAEISEICKKSLRSVFALRISEICKKSLRSIFALRIYETFRSAEF
ncbi:MAG: hypothetical protein BWK80_19645 [Desulfobacteraceae bacterium IS3]|nr:MAG: hypothetical protein BWK80_19645 [Desulfobacteraceae bacterium IS3]